MFPHKRPISDQVDPETYPLGENSEHPDSGFEAALIALSHTPVEHRLYCAMLSSPNQNGNYCEFTARGLMSLTGIGSLSTIRRGLEGLIAKLSVERVKQNGNGKRDYPATYRVYKPVDVIERRQQSENFHIATVPNGNHSFDRAISRVAENLMLSRREAQVALCCVEGLTNAQIGERLDVSEQTVKFHLRHIFVKFGVKRRAELISRLLI